MTRQHERGDVFWQDVADGAAVEFVAKCYDCSNPPWELVFKTREEAQAALADHRRAAR